MKIIFLIIIVSSNFQSFVAEWDRLIVYDGGGILMDNATTGFSTIKQRAETVMYVARQSQRCTASDRFCKCTIGTCGIPVKIVQDLTIILETISTSSASRIGQVAATLYDLMSDIRDTFNNTNQTLSREELQKSIVTTLKSIVEISFFSSIQDFTDRIEDTLRLIRRDLENIVEARIIETRNSAARKLGQRLIILADVTAKLAKIMSGVCNLPGKLLEETYSVTLVTAIVFCFVGQTLIANAKQVNKVGFRDDTASNICMQVSLTLEQYVFVIQRISECPNVQSLREFLPTAESLLLEISAKFRDGIGSAIGDATKYPDSQPLFGTVDGIMDWVRGNKLLQESESAISETVVSLFDVSDAILAARLSCFRIIGFEQSVSVQLRNVLVHLHATFFLIANIPDDCFTSGGTLSMLLATIDAIVDKIMREIKDAVQSVLHLGDITEGASSLISVFEAVVTVATSVVSSVALIFTELNKGSNSVDLSKELPHIMLITKYQIVAAGDRLHETSTDCGNDHRIYQADTLTETSSTFQSFNEFKNDIAGAVSKLQCSKDENRTIVDDPSSTNVDKFVGNIESSARTLAKQSAFGKVIAGAVKDILNEVYDTLNQLSTKSLEKGGVLKLVCLTIWS